MDKKWLSQLKPSDVVIVSHGVCYKGDYISYVERLTKTQIVLKDGTRVNSETGFQVAANGYDKKFIIPPTQERLEVIAKRRLNKKIKTLINDETLMKVSITDLEKILSILEKATAD